MKITQKIEKATKEDKVWWSFEYLPPRTAQASIILPPDPSGVLIFSPATSTISVMYRVCKTSWTVLNVCVHWAQNSSTSHGTIPFKLHGKDAASYPLSSAAIMGESSLTLLLIQECRRADI